MGVSARRRRDVPVLVAVLAAAFWLPAVARADEKPQFVSKPAVQGDPLVGSALTAVATWTGDPTPNATYRWGRCPATSNLCPEIGGATSSQYVPTAADVGSRLAVEITLDNYESQPVVMTSAATGLVRSRPAATAPPPAPSPPASTLPATIPKTAASRAARPSLLDPFPVVRIRGFFRKTGSRITLLSVRGPQKAQVSVRCVGRRCPVKEVTLPSANVRVHAFERFLRAGIQLQIRVTRAGRIGAYTSFLIRARRPPLRVDRCLPSHSIKPVRCSTP